MTETYIKLRDLVAATGIVKSYVAHLCAKNKIRFIKSPQHEHLRLYCLEDTVAYLKAESLKQKARRWFQERYPDGLPVTIPQRVIRTCSESICCSEGTVHAAVTKLRREISHARVYNHR